MMWRISGSSSLRLSGLGPSGARARVVSMQRHSASNWRRPGQEWGSVLFFQHPGCWDLRASGGKVQGDVWVLVK
jgi:hypothetical protein